MELPTTPAVDDDQASRAAPPSLLLLARSSSVVRVPLVVPSGRADGFEPCGCLCLKRAARRRTVLLDPSRRAVDRGLIVSIARAHGRFGGHRSSSRVPVTRNPSQPRPIRNKSRETISRSGLTKRTISEARMSTGIAVGTTRVTRSAVDKITQPKKRPTSKPARITLSAIPPSTRCSNATICSRSAATSIIWCCTSWMPWMTADERSPTRTRAAPERARIGLRSRSKCATPSTAGTNRASDSTPTRLNAR